MNSNYVSSDFLKEVYIKEFLVIKILKMKISYKKKLKNILKKYLHWSTVSLLELWDLIRIQNPC